MHHKQILKKLVLVSLLVATAPFTINALADDKNTNDRHNDGDKPAHCQRHGMQGDDMNAGMGESRMSHFFKELQLSEAQKDKIFTLMHDQASAIRDSHKHEQKIRDELRELAQADQFDDAKAQQLASEKAATEKEKTLTFTRIQAKIFSLLTPEQRKKAREFKMEHRHEDN